MNKLIKTSRTAPEVIPGFEYSFDSFAEGKAFEDKKTGRLPAMGWNSWNAFGSQNTEELTKIMADKIVELELDKLGYEYLVLDDGCYHTERVDGRLKNEKIKFPGGFKSLADYIHSKGLKFGMYNDIGTNLCAGSAVGTCGYENLDAQSYVNWDIDFIKVDNCYYLWDNATFSNGENARFTYAPNIKSVEISKDAFVKIIKAEDFDITGEGVSYENGYVTNIGTFDGTNVGTSPVGIRSGEAEFVIEVSEAGEYLLSIEYASGKEAGCGEWLQIASGYGEDTEIYFDGLLEPTESKETFVKSEMIKVPLKKGSNIIRLMNHRRQENVLISYAAMFYALKAAAKEKDILLSICEWGKTQPHNWGYKVGDSWRILNDISFNVGAPGNPGKANWTDPGTTSITSQYDKAVVMDEFAGLDKGWNDPDMMVIGMDGITKTMEKTHMVMWCMMNSPLMLGMDLRKVNKGDETWNIIANKELIALNQDPLGVQAKRVYCSLEEDNPDKTYITNHDRTDILAKPLANGDIAVSFINLSDEDKTDISISFDAIVNRIGHKMINKEVFLSGKSYVVKDLWTGDCRTVSDKMLTVEKLEANGNVTVRVSNE